MRKMLFFLSTPSKSKVSKLMSVIGGTMISRHSLMFLISLISLLPCSAWADSFSDTIKDVSIMGTSIKLVERKVPLIIIDGSESKYQNEIEILQAMNVLNQSVRSQFFDIRPITVANVVLLLTSASIVESYYKTRSGTVHIIAYLNSRNEYGKKVRLKFLSFDFTKKIYNQIDWNHFASPNLIKVAPNFAYEPWVYPIVSQEMQGVGNQ